MKELGKELEILARWVGRWRVRGGFGTGDCEKGMQHELCRWSGLLSWV